MNDGTGIKWAKRMTIIFGCSALGVAAGAISTTFNQSFPEYMQDAIDNNPALSKWKHHIIKISMYGKKQPTCVRQTICNKPARLPQAYAQDY